jgi:hypothetical protein
MPALRLRVVGCLVLQAADDCPACRLRHISPEEGYEFDDDIEQEEAA